MAASLSLTDERNLLLKLQVGDVHAFDSLYEEYSSQIYHKLYKMVHSVEIAAELHQDVFMKVWEYRERIRADIPFYPFLLSITRNITIDFYRRVALDKKMQNHFMDTGTELYNSVEDQISFKETNLALALAISKLPPKRREVFNHCKIEGKSYEDAALHFNISIGTVKDHMAKAIRFLRAELLNDDLSLLIIPFVLAILS